MKELLHIYNTRPTPTSVQEKNTQELELLVDALAKKVDELGYVLTFNLKKK